MARSLVVFVAGLMLAGTLLVAVYAPTRAERPDKVTLCHEPGTLDQATLTLPAPAVASHLAHADTLSACTSDVTAPTCPTFTISGPPAQAVMTVRDAGSGLASIIVTQSGNADTVVPPFTAGTTDSVVVTSTQIDRTQSAAVELRVTDLAGNTRNCTFQY